MAINPINRSTTMRLMGLASGMDTDTVIQQMLRLQQMKIDSQFRTRTTYEWKQQALNSVKDQITDFRRTFLTAMGASAMRVSSAYNSTIATLTGKNAGAVSIKTSVNSATGKLTIGQVYSLASATKAVSLGNASRDGNGFKLTDKLGDIKTSTGNIEFNSVTGNANVNFDGTNIVLNKNDTIDDINRKLGNQKGNQISFSYTDYQGNKYAKVTINGKQTNLYENEFYQSFGMVTTKDGAVDKKLEDIIGGFDTAKATINGVSLDDIKNSTKTYADLVTNHGSDIGAIDVGWAKVNINGVDIELNAGWPINNFGDIRNLVVSGFESALTPVDGKLIVNINGKNVKLEDNYSFAEINTAIKKAGGAELSISSLNNITINGVKVTLDLTGIEDFGDIFGSDGLASTSLKASLTPDPTPPYDPNIGLTVNGKSIIINTTSSSIFDEINTQFQLAGGSATNSIRFDFAKLNVNGVNIQIDTKATNIFTEINNKILAAPGGGADKTIKFDYKTLTIDGNVDIEINRNDTLIDIAKKLPLGTSSLALVGKEPWTTVPSGIKIDDFLSPQQELNTSSNPTGRWYIDVTKEGKTYRLFNENENEFTQPVMGRWYSDVEVVDYTNGNHTYPVFHEIKDGETTGRNFIDLKIGGTTYQIFQENAQKTFGQSGIADRLNYKVNGSGEYATVSGTPRYLDFEWEDSTLTGRHYGTKTITINGVQIELNSDMTIDDMMNTINKSWAGVTMTYDRMSDQFTIANKNVGEYNLTVGGLEAFGIYYNSAKENMGSKALVDINGETMEFNTNTFDFRGVTITLNNVSVLGKDEKTYEDTVVSFTRDATEPLAKIRDFIDAYNTLIKKLEDLLTERKTRDESTYKPLTDEEKSLMSDKQVEEWEAIAKKALLKNDSGIQSLTNSLRNMLFEQISAMGLSPAQLGLSTGRWDQGLGGQIVLDEDKLRTALEQNPDRVMGVFMGSDDVSSVGGKGFLQKMDDLMYNYIMGSQSNSISNLENSIKRTNEQMEKLQLKMYEEEDKLYKKFAALETAMAKIQSQGEWMASMLAYTNNNNKK